MRVPLMNLGIHLRREFFERDEERPQCPAILRNGARCSKKCGCGIRLCTVHHRMKEDRTERRVCSEKTLKGTPCKCKAYMSLSMCFSHAKKAGVLPEVPTECPICSCDMTTANRVKTTCGHYFCQGCIDHWAETKGKAKNTGGRDVYEVSCPLCRKKVHRLRGPYWYKYGGKAPTIRTSGREWIERLGIVPTAPLPSSVVEENAQVLGRWLLQHDYDSEFMFESQLRIAGFVRHSPPE